MDIVFSLRQIKRLEGALNELYGLLGGQFFDNDEIRTFFLQLSLEEKEHFDLASYQLSVVQKNRHLFSDLDMDMDVFTDVLMKVIDFRRNSLPSIKEALQFTAEIENLIYKQYYLLIKRQPIKEFSALIKRLASDSSNHLQMCIKMAKKYGAMPLSLMYVPGAGLSQKMALMRSG